MSGMIKLTGRGCDNVRLAGSEWQSAGMLFHWPDDWKRLSDNVQQSLLGYLRGRLL